MTHPTSPKKRRTKACGLDLIAAERRRQIDKEDWTPEHDDGHDLGELAMAAACYAAPEPVYRMRKGDVVTEPPWVFESAWPWRWDEDRRRKHAGGGTADPKPHAKLTKARRIDLLTKAGALIAAEIDRLQRTGATHAPK